MTTRPVDLARLRRFCDRRPQMPALFVIKPADATVLDEMLAEIDAALDTLPALLDLADAVVDAVRSGCLFEDVQEPRTSAGSAELIRWGAMRNLHDKIAALTTSQPQERR